MVAFPGVLFTLEARIKGSADAIRRHAADRMIPSAEAEDGTRAYQFFVTEDGARLVVHEWYADNDAVLAHMARVSAMLGPLGRHAEVETVRVYGDVSPRVRATLAAMKPGGVTFHRHLGGFGYRARL